MILLKDLDRINGSWTLWKVHYSMLMDTSRLHCHSRTRTSHIQLQTNKPQAEQHLQHLLRKLERQPPFCEEYMKFMGKVMFRKFAEKVPEDEIQRDDVRVWYVPHHGIFQYVVINTHKGLFQYTRLPFGVSSDLQFFSV